VVLFRHHLVYLRIETWLGCGTIQLEAQMGTLPERISFKKIKKNYEKRICRISKIKENSRKWDA